VSSRAKIRVSVLLYYRLGPFRPHVDIVALSVTSTLVCHKHQRGTNAGKRLQEVSRLRVENAMPLHRSMKARSTDCPYKGESSHRLGQSQVPSSNMHDIGQTAAA
jgi:hypothetical protein